MRVPCHVGRHMDLEIPFVHSFVPLVWVPVAGTLKSRSREDTLLTQAENVQFVVTMNIYHHANVSDVFTNFGKYTRENAHELFCKYK